MTAFRPEPSSYSKTALSDLQGAWALLREAVVDNFGFQNSERLLFHIDEATSWECVRDLQAMEQALVLVHNLAVQTAPPDIIELVDEVRESLKEVQSVIAEGQRL